MLGQRTLPLFKTLWLACLVALPACTDLGAVREWSATSMQAAQFNEVVTTYKDTPGRLKLYDKDEAAFWAAQETIREEQAEALELQLALIADYMGALAALSADSATNYSEDVGSLTSSLQNTGRLSESTVGAAGKLATTLLNAAAQAWQKEKVGELIGEANAPLQKILAGELRAIVDEDFRRDIKIEASFLDAYFEDLLRFGGGSAAANVALNEWFLVRKAENEKRAAAVDSYVAVLDKIAEGHQKLHDSRDDLDAVELGKDLFKLAKEIRKNIKNILKS